MMSIKLKYLCLAHRKYPTDPPVHYCREEEINTSAQEVDWNKEIFDLTPSPCGINEA